MKLFGCSLNSLCYKRPTSYNLNLLFSRSIVTSTSNIKSKNKSSKLNKKLNNSNVFLHTTSNPTNNIESNDELITKIFDSQDYWLNFNVSDDKKSSNLPSNSIFNSLSFNSISNKNSIGLFCNPYLINPKGLKKFADESLDRARALTNHMIKDQSIESMKSYIKELDRLSDMLCRVIDLCEFIRAAHPNSSFIKVAEQCHAKLFEHMNILNTSKPLFLKLQKVLYDEKLGIRKLLSKEEIAVGELLYSDFKKSGIDMDDETGEQFVQLSSFIATAGQEFNNNITIPKSNSIKIAPTEWKESDINPEYLKSVSRGFDGSLTIPIYGHIPFELLRSCPNKIIREKIWVALHSVPDNQLNLLTNLLRCRAILAKLMGCNNYSQYALEDKMAHNPDNVVGFLRGLINDLQPKILKELKVLYKYFPSGTVKENPTDEELVNSIKPWDREFLLTKHIIAQKSSQSEDITHYFSLGTVVSGLSKLFHSIYGIKLVPQKLKPGEVWSEDVRRFDAISDKDGKVGIMYLDLLHRTGKTPHPAHFTVCCSRRLDDTELDKNDPFNLSLPTTSTVETVIQDGKTYQLPVISLVCNYYPSSNTSGIICLTLEQVATLFHEMGHAMHSMLGRTALHNVSGTRCQTDFVELPSILHETFARDERVLSAFGKHYKTGKPVSTQLVKKHLESDKILTACETFGQIKMALLDQLYHGASGCNVNDESFDLIDLYHQLESNLMILADTKSSWPGKFGHLYSYGSLYYSYLLDRAIASKVWTELFEKNPLSREAGEKFKNEVLRWGGSRDPWVCLSKVLNVEELAKGDVKAMQFISKNSDHL